MSRNQRGAMYLHKCKIRSDKSFDGIVRIANPKAIEYVKPRDMSEAQVLELIPRSAD